ncbi:MAG: glycosyltransferase family 39 protein [Lachnospiraceae bacterium]|nr:glycosyltransferase family 39 protein [Lachnospiraceae bacterium]
MRECIRKYKTHIIVLLASLAAIFLRYVFRDNISDDMSISLLPWYEQISGMGFKEALRTQIGDYNFLYQIVIFVLTRLPGEAVYKYKIFSGVFDFILAAGVYAFVKKLTDRNKALIAYIMTLFLPTVWMNSAPWGQCDSIYVSLIIWALYFLYTDKTIRCFVFLGLSFAFKLQAVFIIPFIVLVYICGLLRHDKRIRLYHFAVSAGTIVLMALPNIIAGRPFSDMISIYKDQTHAFESISRNYPSIWNILHLTYDADAVWCIGFTFIVLASLMVFIILKKADITGKHFMWCAFILSYTCVMFLPAMHERYGYLYEILVLILAFTDSLGWLAVLIFQLISVKTYIYFLYHVSLNLEFLSIVNVLVYAGVLWLFYRELLGRSIKSDLFSLAENRDDKVHRFASKENFKISRKDYLAMIILTGIFLIIGSMHLGRKDAPVTYEEFGTDSECGTEVYVSLDAFQDVSLVCIYPLMSGSESFDLYYAEGGEWKKVDEELTLKGVFTWKKVDVNVQTHQFCIIFSDPKVQIAEIACIDPYGNRIGLLEGSEPAAVFDEQDTITGVPTSFDSMIFDEVYHGRTAYEFLKGMKIYENTHPPLGKTLISIGIRLYGMNPFGYRIIVLIFGMMCIPLMYLLSLRVTGDRRYACLAGVLQITEFMHFVLSRISTIDIIVAFFVLCMFYGCFAFICEEKNRHLVFAGASFALGVSTKWTAVYAAAGLALILFIWMIGKIRNKTKSSVIVRFVLICLGSFVVLPAAVYVLSYIPFTKVYPDKGLIENAISNSIHMLDYHSHVTASHPFQSSWYTWPFDWIPLLDSRTIFGDRMSLVATFVNPFVCYAGLISVVHHIYMTVKKKDVTSALLLVFYISMFLPWVFISRTVFIYQYFICTKVLILMICRSIQCMGFKHENSVIKLTAVVSTALFVVFFPVLSGVMVSMKYLDEILTMLPNWWF